MKKKISILIINKYFYLNYLEILTKTLKTKYSISFIFNKNLETFVKSKKFFLKNKKSIFFYDGQKNLNSIRRVMWLLRWSKIHKEKKLKIFQKKSFPTLNTYLEQNNLFVNFKKKNFFYLKYFFKYFFYNFPRNIFYYFLSLRLIFNIYLYVFKFIKKNEKYDFFFILKNLNPNLVLFPNRLAEVETYKLLNDLSFLNSIKSYFIVDKWDNLGSKTALLKKPNFIGLWGEQAFQLAKINHKFKNSQIFKIGSVRLSDKIVSYKNKKKNFSAKNQLLYLGSSSSENIELNFLKKISYKLLKNDLKTVIIYRIHPRANKKLKSLIRREKLKNVLIDGGKKYLNLHKIIQNSILNFSTAISTVSMESLFLKRPHYIFLDKEDKSFYSSYNHFLIADHYRGINKLKGIKLYFDQKKFINEIILKLNQYKNNKKIDNVETKNFSLFHVDNGFNFEKNLNNSINKVLK